MTSRHAHGVDASRAEEWGLEITGGANERHFRSVGELARGVRRRLWMVALGGLIGVSAAAAFSMRQSVRYTASATIEILRTPPLLLPVRDVVSGGVSGFEDMYTQQQWAASATMTERVAQRLTEDEVRRLQAGTPTDASAGPMPVTAILAANRRVDTVRVSRLLSISFQHADPALAARVANLYADVFVAAQTDARTLDARRATEELREKGRQQRKAIEETAHSLHEYKERNDVVSLDARRDLVTARLQEVNTRVTQRAAHYDEVAARWKLLQETRTAGRPLTDISFIADAPQVYPLQQEIIARNLDLARLRDRYRDAHPRVIEARAGLTAAIDALNEAVQSAEATAENAVTLARQALQQEREKLAEQEKESLRLQRLAIDYDTISRDLAVNEELYQNLLIRMNETALVGASKTSTARVIDRAVAPDLLSSRRHLVRIGLGAVAGLAAGLLLATMRAFLDDRVTSAGDAESALGRPVLGELPVLRRRPRKHAAPPLVTPADDIRAHEAFRDLYCLLRARQASRETQVVVITSAAPREGKSYVAANLARMCAAHGEPTLLIDANLRRPVLHICFGAAAEQERQGLRQVEAARGELEGLVTTSSQPQLDLLPAGGESADPMRVLGSRAFVELLRQARTKYRRIIIDAPAASVSDASLLLDLADGCLFVTRFNRTRQRPAASAAAHLESSRAPIWGAILNAMPARKAARKFRPEQQDIWDVAPPPATNPERPGELAPSAAS